MTNLIKLPITIAALLMVATPANAQETFSVTLKQNSSVSVEANYASMDDQAKRFCKREIRRDLGNRASVPPRLVRECAQELMQKAVEQINDPILTAFHNQQNGEQIKFANSKTDDTQTR